MLHAVIPAAGRGTRLAPVTRAVPKELLPLGTRPVLDHVLDELNAAGVARVVLVAAPGKRALLEHLSGNPAVSVAWQADPLGLGDAVLQAEGETGEEPFVVALPDALFGGPAALRALLDVVAARDLDGAVAVERVAPERASHYGIVGTHGDGLIRELVEKPAPGTAPSDLAIAARYVLPPAIFAALRATEAGSGGEVQLTDALARLVAAGARIAAVPLPAGVRRQDVGSPAGYAAAFVDYALADPDLAPAVRDAFDARRDG
ncbi:MAG: UTP--glucose-phosphate uridylyltransferase [Solirubrobacterales bacterium]|nr:UTP--glucose-phosphate uridylyltransferase [Solirubrobacterales bacterium]